MTRGQVALLASVVMLIASCIIGVTVFAFVRGRADGVAGGVVVKSGKMPGAVAGDPWSECGPIRAWLKENENDPASVEIVDWEKRWESATGRPTVYAIIKLRSRNKLGALVIHRTQFTFQGGEIVQAFDADTLEVFHIP